MRVVHVEAQRIATLSCDEPLREKAGEVTFVIRVPVATPVAEVLYCFFISNLAAAFQALFPTLKTPSMLPVQAHLRRSNTKRGSYGHGTAQTTAQGKVFHPSQSKAALHLSAPITLPQHRSCKPWNEPRTPTSTSSRSKTTYGGGRP